MKHEAPVWRYLAGGPVLAGTLLHDAALQLWRFQYDAAYLARSDAMELDPHWLRTLSASPFKHLGPTPPGAFADVALSGWSFDVVRKALSRRSDWSWWDRLVLAPDDGFGALAVGNLAAKPVLIDAFAHAALNASSESLRAIQADSSSGALGGERPKLAIVAQGKACLLKFAAPGDPADSALAEATALSLAGQLGMRVPVHRTVQMKGARGDAEPTVALMLERFDRAGSGNPERIHAVSAACALGLPPGSDAGHAQRSYRALCSMLRERGDGLELFRRVVLNAVVHNQDDHPWNQSLVQLGRGRWALSLLYDVLPSAQARHPSVHRMDLVSPPFASAKKSGISASPIPATRRVGDLATLVLAGQQMAQLHPEQARSEIERIATHVAKHWRQVFMSHSHSALPSVRAESWRASFEGFLPLLEPAL